MGAKPKLRITDLRVAAKEASSWSNLAQQFGVGIKQLQFTCNLHGIKPEFTQIKHKRHERAV